MKTRTFKSAFFVLMIAASLDVASCKNKTDENTNTQTNADTTTAITTDTSMNSMAPATASDDSLRAQLKDATKDYPTVTATVDDGEVTLTGTISREKLPSLMQSINALNPKKVNNSLTIK